MSYCGAAYLSTRIQDKLELKGRIAIDLVRRYYMSYRNSLFAVMDTLPPVVQKKSIFYFNTPRRHTGLPENCFALNKTELNSIYFLARNNNLSINFYKMSLEAVNYNTLSQEQKNAIDFIESVKVKLDTIYWYFLIVTEIVTDYPEVKNRGIWPERITPFLDFHHPFDNIPPDESFIRDTPDIVNYVNSKKKLWISESIMQTVNELNLLMAITNQ